MLIYLLKIRILVIMISDILSIILIAVLVFLLVKPEKVKFLKRPTRPKIIAIWMVVAGSIMSVFLATPIGESEYLLKNPLPQPSTNNHTTDEINKMIEELSTEDCECDEDDKPAPKKPLRFFPPI